MLCGLGAYAAAVAMGPAIRFFHLDLAPTEPACSVAFVLNTSLAPLGVLVHWCAVAREVQADRPLAPPGALLLLHFATNGYDYWLSSWSKTLTPQSSTLTSAFHTQGLWPFEQAFEHQPIR